MNLNGINHLNKLKINDYYLIIIKVNVNESSSLSSIIFHHKIF